MSISVGCNSFICRKFFFVFGLGDMVRTQHVPPLEGDLLLVLESVFPATRCSALSHPFLFWGEGSPTKIDYRKKQKKKKQKVP